MKFRLIIAAVTLTALVTAIPARAQGTAPAQPNPPRPPTAERPPAPPQTAPAPAPQTRVEGPLTSLRIELTITDQRGGASPLKKTITVMAADGLLSRIRSASYFTGLSGGEVPLNVDMVPIVRGAKVRLSLTLQYDLPVMPSASGEAPKGPNLYRTNVSETLNTIVDDGKSQVVAQSADPITDRQVTIEVKATIVR